MKKGFASEYLSVALAVVAFAAASAVPASAQALSHDGSLLPHYFDSVGDLKWRSWGSATADQEERGAGSSLIQQTALPSRNEQAALPSRNKQAALPSRHLYLYARSRSSHARSS